MVFVCTASTYEELFGQTDLHNEPAAVPAPQIVFVTLCGRRAAIFEVGGLLC